MPSSARVTATATSRACRCGVDDLRALGGGEVVGLVLHGENDHVLVNVGVVAEDAGQFPHPLLPCGAVDGDGRGDGADVRLRGLLAEVGRGVFFLGADLGFGLDAEVVVERVAVAGVGGEPEGTREGFAVVAERKLQAVDGRAAMRAVGVVELGIADADLHVGGARAAAELSASAPYMRAHGDEARVADRVTEEVGRQLLVAGAAATGADLPSEVKARCSSVVMASRRTGTGCWARAAAGRTSSETIAAAGTRGANGNVRSREMRL